LIATTSRTSPKTTAAAEGVGFPYRPLADDSFRVLDLLPGSGNSVIRCNLRHTTLSSPTPFSALSYVWGPRPSRADAHVELDGRLVPIRKNLLAFFKVFRHPQWGLTVWADAICINQANTQERNQQVSIMGRLYRRAHEVLAWLGEEADDSDKLFDYISSPGGESLHDHATMLKRYISLFGKPNSLYFWSALAALFRREYWTRLWIVQEILLAQILRCTVVVNGWT
jgi:hypothetical protein